jgi:hypothetical protein
MSKKLIKWAGLSAFVGGVLACGLTPLMSIGYYQAYPVAGERPPFWYPSVQPALNFLFNFADEKVVYATYGKLFALVYLLFLPGVWALHKLQEKTGSKLEKFSFVFLLIALIVAFIGVSLDYWGIKAGWTTELLGMLLLLIGSSFYGAAGLRLKIIPRLLALIYLAAIPLCVVAFLLVKQIPSAPTLPFALASIAAGAFVLSINRQDHEAVTGLGSKEEGN